MTRRDREGPIPARLAVPAASDRLTHYLFRYPAKFHPPVVRALLERYTKEDHVVLDPFCGSGTLLIEAAVAARRSIGVDVDPLAVAVARAKTQRHRPAQLTASAARLTASIMSHQRRTADYVKMVKGIDLSDRRFAAELSEVSDWVPALPRIDHWFRRYVTIDLARIRREIANAQVPEPHRSFFEVVFGSIIRNASNADPVPVSGLEVTAHMLRKEAEGRVIDPFMLFAIATERAVAAATQYAHRLAGSPDVTVTVGDATTLPRHVRRSVDAVITSPPYHNAVDYYRRHLLEMFWLGLTPSAEDRLALLPRYIGRPKVRKSHPLLKNTVLTGLAAEWEARIRTVDQRRADDLRHYLVAMRMVFDGLRERVRGGGPVLLVVGHSTWKGAQIPTTGLFSELAGPGFILEEVLWYPVSNRYMSYTRHNGANIDTEYVLVFRREAD